MPSTDHRFKDAEGDIWQRMVNNSDWTYSELLYSRLDVQEIPDKQFVDFLEACVHPLVIPDPDQQKQLVSDFNAALVNDGFEMRPG